MISCAVGNPKFRGLGAPFLVQLIKHEKWYLEILFEQTIIM